MREQVCEVCTGCGACAFKCPKSAIYFDENARKEYVAVIDKSLCIDCKLCKKVCAQLYTPALQKPKETYCAWTKDLYDYKTTSSGGIGTMLAKQVISQGGVVYGASYISGEDKVRHIRIDNINGLEAIKGSKYIQSDFRDLYTLIQEDIQRGKRIMVIGVPCQIASIRNSFSDEEIKNIFLIDLVCHGTPPEAYFKDYLNTICSENEEHVEVAFRRKDYKLSVYHDMKCIYYKKYEIDPYYRSFMYGLIFRENCYLCKYSKADRVGDITIGDFWGIDRKKTNLELPKFVSCVLVNTEKGNVLFEQIKNDCYTEVRSTEEAIAGNTNLQHASQRHLDRDLFLQYIENGASFIDAVNKTSIKRDIMKCKIGDVIKAPYRKIKYGKWGGGR